MLKHWVSKLRPAASETAPKTSLAEPTREPGIVAKALVAAGIKPPPDYVEQVERYWDDKLRRPVIRVLNPLPEPEGLRPKFYHMAYHEFSQPRWWLFPGGRRGSWWDRR